MILKKEGHEETELFYHIFIDGRIMIDPIESESYSYSDREEFDSDEDFMRWVHANLTAEFTGIEDLNEDCIFNDDGDLVNAMSLNEYEGLPKYSYGEYLYWPRNEWADRDRPNDIYSVRRHYESLFPNSEVKVMKRLIQSVCSVTTSMSEVCIDGEEK